MKTFIKRFLYYLPKTLVTRIRYKYSTGKNLNMKEPEDFNQKIIYLQLEEFGELEKDCADKYKVRDYVSSKGLDNILTKLYGVYDSAEKIDFSMLPDEYVLKTNHGCGCTYIKTKSNNIDFDFVINALNKSLKENYAKETLEYHYSKIKPLIICEELIKDKKHSSPIDYKFFCFNGVPKFILVLGDRDSTLKRQYYDFDWNVIECTKTKEIGDFNKPKNFDKMIEVAAKLSEDFKFVRVDLYNVDGKIYFGELTFTPHGGINNTIKQEYLDEWGKMIKL